MRVSETLVSGCIVVRPTWASFDQTITALVDQLVVCGRLPTHMARSAVEHIRERERVASTAMVDIGVAIPHARLDGVNGIVAAMAVSPGAVYEVAAGLPISIVALVLSAPSQTGEHLNFLSALSLLLQSTRVRKRLCDAATAEDVWSLVRSNEQPRG